VAGDILITPKDIQRAGYCSRGARRWFESHNINFRDFIRKGVPASQLTATGDPQALRVVELAMEAQHG
jgi:hypothetical protein